LAQSINKKKKRNRVRGPLWVVFEKRELGICKKMKGFVTTFEKDAGPDGDGEGH